MTDSPADPAPAGTPARRPRDPRSPRIGLALGGGGARGLAHIHVLEELDALGLRPVAIAGSSIGAIVGAGYAAGMSGAEIRLHSNEMFQSGALAMRRVWRSKAANLSDLRRYGFHFGQFNIENVLGKFLPERLPATFDDLTVPFTAIATDFYRHQEARLDSGDLFSAVAASAAVPVLFRPVRRDGGTYIDATMSNPVPFDVFGDDVDLVIAVDVVGFPPPTVRAPTSLEVMFGASQLMMQSIVREKLKHSKPDILLRPEVTRFKVLDFLKIEHVLNETDTVRLELREALLRLIPEYFIDTRLPQEKAPREKRASGARPSA